MAADGSELEDLHRLLSDLRAAGMVDEAERLSARIRNDPFGDHKDRVVHLQLSAGRYAAEAFLDKLRAQAAKVHDDVERAARGIAGFERPPLPDVGELGEWLARIEQSHGTRSEQLAELNTWQQEADSAAQGLTDAAERAGAMLARRERLRGRWKVLSRRADELDALEHPAIDAVRGPIRHQLETGHCHLDAVEGHLAELAKLLDEIEAGRP